MSLTPLAYTDHGEIAVDKINAGLAAVDTVSAASAAQAVTASAGLASVLATVATQATSISQINTNLVSVSDGVVALNGFETTASARLSAIEGMGYATLAEYQSALAGGLASTLVNTLLSGSNLLRPGDGPRLFCSSLAGGDPNLLPADYQGVIVATDGGAALRITDASLLACRQMDAIEPGRTYKLRGAFRRRTDSPDPAGDAISFGVAWYDSNKIMLSTSVLNLDITVEMGRQELVALVGGASPVGPSGTFQAGDTITPPAAACYARRFVEFFGVHVTDVQVMSWIDVSESGLVSVNVDAVAARIAAIESYELPARIDLLSSEVVSPISMRVASFGQAQATTVPNFIEVVSTVGYVNAGVGAASYARASALSPGGFRSIDGSYWSLAESRPTLAMFGGDPTGSSDNASIIAGLPASLTLYVGAGLYVVGTAVSTAATLMVEGGASFIGSGSVSGDLRLVDGLDDGVLKGRGIPDGGYLPATPSLPYRTSLRTLLKDWRHVSENGADPGLADNYPNIFAANNEACARGQMLIWGKGTYNCASQPFWLTNQSKWRGLGRGLTTLRVPNAGGHAVLGMLSRARLCNRDILVEGFTVDANGQDPANTGIQAIQLGETVNATIRDLDIINVAANGFNAASNDDQPGAPYVFAPAPYPGCATLQGTTLYGNINVSGLAGAAVAQLVVGAKLLGSGIPTGAFVTFIAPDRSYFQMNVGATAAATITIEFAPVFRLCSVPDGCDFPTNYDLIVERVRCTSIATLGSAGASSDMFVIYGVDGGYAADIELHGGGGNQFSVGFASNFSVHRSEHHGYWRSGLYVETSLGLVIDNPRFYAPAPQPIHPALQSSPPVCLMITTAEQSYSSGVYGVPGAPYAGGRGISVDNLRANGIVNTFNNKGPVVIDLIARSGLPSKGIMINNPVIENVSSSAGSSPDGTSASNAIALGFDGHHVATTVRGGRIVNVPRAIAGIPSVFDGTERMINPSFDGLYLESISDTAILQDGPNHGGLRLTNITLGPGVNNAMSQTNGAASQPSQVSYGHIGTDSGNVALPSAKGL